MPIANARKIIIYSSSDKLYLEFREGMQHLFGDAINNLLEQVIFGKYVSGHVILCSKD